MNNNVYVFSCVNYVLLMYCMYSVLCVGNALLPECRNIMFSIFYDYFKIINSNIYIYIQYIYIHTFTHAYIHTYIYNIITIINPRFIYNALDPYPGYLSDLQSLYVHFALE